MRCIQALVFVGMLGISCLGWGATQPLSGVYLGGFGGATFAKAKVGSPRSIVYRQDTYNEMGMHAGLQLGVRMMSWRVALEGSLNSKISMDNYDLTGHQYGAQIYYDLPFRSPLRPYLNIGYAHYLTQMETDPGVKQKSKRWNFNFGGGLTLALTRRTNLDVGYRFVNLGRLTLHSSDEAIPVKLLQHQVYMGFRYVF